MNDSHGRNLADPTDEFGEANPVLTSQNADDRPDNSVFWDRRIPTPDLDHRPATWCARCDQVVAAVWTWRTGVPPTGSVRYGKQYDYRCPSCRGVVVPRMTPSLAAMDLTNLGTRIGDRAKPLAPATMARAERCRQRFADFPAILMPAKAVHGSERHPWQPMATQTSQQETAILSTGALIAAAGNTYERPGSTCRSRDLSQPLWAQTATNTTGLIAPPVAITGQTLAAHRHNGDGKHISLPMDTVTSTHEKALLLAVTNYQGGPRGSDEPLPTQGGSETLGIVSSGVVPFRRNTVPTNHAEAMPTVTSDQIPGLLTAAGVIKNNGSIDEAQYRAHPASDPLGTVVGSAITQGLHVIADQHRLAVQIERPAKRTLEITPLRHHDRRRHRSPREGIALGRLMRAAPRLNRRGRGGGS
ncbi:Uncharacterised protein [Mycobacteroides abscessus subsp. abscessus]|nr:hypothetical protein [Mycobacteroides abscessus]SLC74029.1 Uncharacterised protein [Mycobacteroides abscessus subsp. abscessus]